MAVVASDLRPESGRMFGTHLPDGEIGKTGRQNSSHGEKGLGVCQPERLSLVSHFGWARWSLITTVDGVASGASRGSLERALQQ